MDAAGWNARYADADLVWGAQPNRFVEEVFDGLPPGRALDLAAGEGRNALWLAGLGWRVTAVDFSTVAIERGRRLAAEQRLAVDWTVADVRDYRPPREFDAVLVAYLHLPAADMAGVFRTAAGAVAAGGLLVVIGHDVRNLDEGVGGPQDPGVLYTPDSIVSALSGLDVRRAERALRPVAKDGDVVPAVDTIVVAARPAG